VLINVSISQEEQTTHAGVTMLFEVVAATEQVPAGMQDLN
jgi:hypothetical protein